MKAAAPILDACCGSRMFWFNKKNPNVVYMDIRKLETTLCDGRLLEINPDVVGDFRNMPFDDNQFNLVVFDPPHLLKAGQDSWLAQKYGLLAKTWHKDLAQGFAECFRVLKPFGILIFKWNEEQVKLSDILKLTPEQPLIGHCRGKTHFLVFIKEIAEHGGFNLKLKEE